ncbi:MAG TPA: hypothetical protein VNI53_04455 [Gammaproteobacteria bacterium]|jgi:hypothetical protein|nr:hypothetical protein [Gammaproteobacteria bacterium]
MIVKSHFSDTARQAFSFLEEIGFHCKNYHSTSLQYETNQVFVTIVWDPQSGELNVYIGLQPREGQSRDDYSLGDILGMQNIEIPERYRPFEVADETQLCKFIEKLANDTRLYAKAALGGDRMFFRRLRMYRDTQSQALMLGMKLRHIRSEIGEAWNKREFDKVANLYVSIESYLTEVEKEKLKYAKSQLREE